MRAMVRLLLSVGVVVFALGCKPARKAPPPPLPYGGYGPPIAATPFLTAPPPPAPVVTAPAPPVGPQPPAPAAPTNLVARARPTLSMSTLSDEVILVLSVQGESGYLTADDPLGKESLKLADVRFTVAIEGAQTMTLASSALPAAAGSVALHDQPAMALRLSGAGISLISWMTQVPPDDAPTAPWATAPSSAPLSQIGEYELTVSVELPFAAGNKTVSAPPVKIERRARGRSTTTLRDVEKLAHAAAVIHLNKLGRTQDKALLQPTLLSVDLPEDNHQRLVRFWLPHGDDWKILFFEVVVERNGTVAKIHTQERFTCVAAGTLIDTATGRVAVEALKRGDRVWSWDLERKERVLSEVVAISEPRPAATLLIEGKLRVTGSHPIYADGGWVRASELAPSAALVSADGTALSLSQVDHDRAVAEVYDISVTWPHNYFADGILVHNKRLVLPPALLDPAVVLWERAAGTFDLLAPRTP